MENLKYNVQRLLITESANEILLSIVHLQSIKGFFDTLALKQSLLQLSVWKFALWVKVLKLSQSLAKGSYDDSQSC